MAIPHQFENIDICWFDIINIMVEGDNERTIRWLSGKPKGVIHVVQKFPQTVEVHIQCNCTNKLKDKALCKIWGQCSGTGKGNETNIKVPDERCINPLMPDHRSPTLHVWIGNTYKRAARWWSWRKWPQQKSQSYKWQIQYLPDTSTDLQNDGTKDYLAHQVVELEAIYHPHSHGTFQHYVQICWKW